MNEREIYVNKLPEKGLINLLLIFFFCKNLHLYHKHLKNRHYLNTLLKKIKQKTDINAIPGFKYQI